jgi:hypothetical protein
MLGICWRCAVRLKIPQRHKIRRLHHDSPQYAPKIVFFGSDTFSVVSLSKLHNAQKVEPDLFESLEIVTREPSPRGRGLKRQKSNPLAE